MTLTGLPVTCRMAASASTSSLARQEPREAGALLAAEGRADGRGRSRSCACIRHCRAKSAAIPRPAKLIVAGLAATAPRSACRTFFANSKAFEDIFTVGLNRAVTLIAEKQNRGPGRRGTGQTALRDLGEHPKGGGPVQVFAGRYGLASSSARSTRPFRNRPPRRP